MSDSQKCFIGISRHDFDPFWVQQKEEKWCWNACQEMLFNYNGINEKQEQIALKLCGFSISGSAASRVLTPGRLEENVPHYCDLDGSGKFYAVSIAVSREPMNIRSLLKELKEGRPVIVHCEKTGMSRSVIITGAQVLFEKQKAIITKLYIRDPDSRYSDEKGRRVLTSPAKFLGHVDIHWYVSAALLDIPSHYNQIVAF